MQRLGDLAILVAAHLARLHLLDRDGRRKPAKPRSSRGAR